MHLRARYGESFQFLVSSNLLLVVVKEGTKELTVKKIKARIIAKSCVKTNNCKFGESNSAATSIVTTEDATRSN